MINCNNRLPIACREDDKYMFLNQFGCNLSSFCPCPVAFKFNKIHGVTGQWLSGAVFTLEDECGCVQQATSNNGLVCFMINRCTDYRLTESAAPPGYELSTDVFRVCADRSCNILINGEINNNLVIPNTPLATSVFSFSFLKAGEDGITPLPGALFILIQGSVAIKTALSNESGNVLFQNVEPGTYILVETAAPPGFVPDPNNYQVVVNTNGTVTIGGISSTSFVVTNTLA